MIGLQIYHILWQVLYHTRCDTGIRPLSVVEIDPFKNRHEPPRKISPNIRIDRPGIDGNGSQSLRLIAPVQFDRKQQGGQFGGTVRVLFADATKEGMLAPIGLVVLVILRLAIMMHDAGKIDDAWIIGIEEELHQVASQEKMTEEIGFETQVQSLGGSSTAIDAGIVNDQIEFFVFGLDGTTKLVDRLETGEIEGGMKDSLAGSVGKFIL